LIIIASSYWVAWLRLCAGRGSLYSVRILKFFSLFFSKLSRIPLMFPTLASPRSISPYMMSSTRSDKEDYFLPPKGKSMIGGASISGN
jgi:hypothetical protein